jgi:hypothetical protein
MAIQDRYPTEASNRKPAANVEDSAIFNCDFRYRTENIFTLEEE